MYVPYRYAYFRFRRVLFAVTQQRVGSAENGIILYLVILNISFWNIFQHYSLHKCSPNFIYLL
jgi:hypothetical protein